MRYAKELHTLQEFDEQSDLRKAKVKIKPQEVALAEQLVTSMSGKWQPEKYVDNNKELLKKLINADIKKGKSVSKKSKAAPKSEKVVDFAELLKKSVANKSKSKTTAKRKS